MEIDAESSENADSANFKNVIEPVVLSFGFSAHDVDPPRLVSCSCFILAINGQWVMCTAAHVLRDIEALEQQSVRMSNWHINDAFSQTEASFVYPFDVRTREQLIVQNDAFGLDYCLIFIEELAVRNLVASGVRAIGREMIADAEAAFKWVVTGFPSKFTQKNGQKIKQRHYIIGAAPQSRPDDWPPGKNIYSMFGKLDQPTLNDGENIDIGGMSGGPVFGLIKKESGAVEVRLVAVQSGWRPVSRIITACPIAPFLDAVQRLIDDQAESKAV